MNSMELEIFDQLQGFEVENITIDRNGTVHGNSSVVVTVKRAGYEPDEFGFAKVNKMGADSMGTIIRQTLTRELAR